MKRICWLIILGGILIAGAGCTRHSVSSSSRPPASSSNRSQSAATAPSSPKPYKALGQWYQPLPDARGFKQTGIASWYGEDFHGKKTSSGEIYDMYAESAAHKTLPLGTIVRVRNLDNNREMEVRINDRGPFVTGRIIDLSHACASKLGVLGPGTAPVELVAVGTTALAASSGAGSADFYYRGNFTIQVGAFSDRSNAEKLKIKLDKSYQNAHIQSYDNGREIFFRVRVTKCSSLEQAVQNEKTLASGGYDGAFAVAE
ncbi:MAG: septal ring lytic transglycosylase RlpA family protein [Deltaproteobacteria bacterium]|nr:septal ring lytic transglycosylase RlpA family protein [Deltaproteobacteria bacterium]